MALSARDYYFAVRVEDRASRPLRNIGREIRGLKTASKDLTAQKARVLQAQRQLALQQGITRSELRSITTGQRRAALDRDIASQKRTAARAATSVASTEKQIIANQAAQLKSAAQLSKLERYAGAKTPRALRGFTVAETQTLYKAAQEAQTALIAQEKILYERLEQAEKAMADQSLSAGALGQREVELASRTQILNERLGNQAGALKVTQLRLDELTAAEARMKWERLQTGVRVMQNMGRLARNVGFIATGALGFAALSAAKFQTQIMLAATQARPVGAPTRVTFGIANQLDKEVRQYMASGKAVGSAKELANSLYEIFSGVTLPGKLNTQLSEGSKLLREFNQVAKANYGLVSFDEVTRAGIIALNNFSGGVKGMPRTLNTMQAAVRFGRMTMSEFVQSLNQTAPAARAAHYSFLDMAAATAFLSRHFPSVRMGAAGYARLVEVLRKGATGLKAMGIQALDSEGRLRPLDQLIGDIARKRPDLASGRGDLMAFFKQISGTQGTIQARRAFTFFIQFALQYRSILAQIRHDHAELASSAAAAGQSAGVKWTELRGQLENVALAIGEQAIPAFQKLARPIERLLHWFNNLSPHTQRLIGYFGTFAAVGGLLGGQLLVLAGGATALFISLRLMTGGLAAFGAEAGAVQARTMLMMGAFGIFMILLIRYPHLFQTLTNAVGGTKNAILLLGLAALAVRFGGLITGMSAAGTMAIVVAGEVDVLYASIAALVPLLGLLGVAGALAVTGGGAATMGDKYSANFGDKHLSFLKKAANYLSFTAFAGDPIFKPKAPPGVHQGTRGVIPYPGGASPLDRIKRFGPVMNRVYGPTSSTYGAAAPGGFVDARTVRQLRTEVFKLDSAQQQALATAQKHPTSKSAWDAYEQAFKKYQNTYTLYTQRAGSEDSKALKKRLSAQDAALRKALRAANAASNAAGRQAAADAKKNANDISDQYQQVAQQIQSLYQQMQQQNESAFGQIGAGPFFTQGFGSQMLQISQQAQIYGEKIHIPFSYVLTDINQQVDAYQRLQTAIDSLIREGLPAKMVQQLEQLGPQGVAILESIAGASPGQRAQYIKKWKEGQKLIEQSTKRDLQLQLKIWRQFGQDVATAILTGIQDESGPLRTYLTAIVNSLVGHPGKPLPIPHGAHRAHTPAPRIRPPATHGPGVRRMAAYGGGHGGDIVTNNYFSQIVHANLDETFDGTIKRANFRWRNQILSRMPTPR